MIDPVASYAGSTPDAIACVDLESGRCWTYRQFHTDADRVGGWLVAQLGPASGARVATLARNSASLLILRLACVRAGAIYVPFNWRLAAGEIAQLAQDAAPLMMFVDPEFVAPSICGAVHHLADLFLLAADAPARPPAIARRGDDATSTLLYTSGTSGKPKGVMLSETNIFWGSINFNLGNGVSSASVFLCDMPLFHTAGLFANSQSPLLAGARVLVSRGFDPAVSMSRLADPALGVTHYFSVPQMANALWNAPGFDPAMLRGLAVYAMGGAPNPAVQIERFVRAGVRMSDGFGMSETGSNFGMPVADLELVITKAGSCGRPYLALETRIVDDDGADLPDGMAGELWLRGPTVTTGYWNQPEQTARAFTGGWFRTGDVAYRDTDGFFTLIDRRKDMFISGGENVYPAEIEAVLAGLETIAEAAVIGVPDARWGEVGRAYVIPRAGAILSAESVIAHCRARLAAFKVPASVAITDTIPRTASGKIQKHVLQARAAAGD